MAAAALTDFDGAWADIEAISDSVRRALECPVCLQLTPNNMTCPCPNGHPVCQTCAAELQKRNAMDRCPMCRLPISPSAGPESLVAPVKLAQVTAVVKVVCSHRPFGCNNLIAVRHVTDHEKSCPHKPTARCRVSGCQWLGAYDQLYNHVVVTHPASALNTICTSLLVENVNHISHNRKQTYLIRALHGMFWVTLTRMSWNRIKTVVSEVNKPSHCPSVNTTYRIVWVDTNGNIRGRSRLRNRNQMQTWGRDDEITPGTSSVIRSLTGLIQIIWKSSVRSAPATASPDLLPSHEVETST